MRSFTALCILGICCFLALGCVTGDAKGGAKYQCSDGIDNDGDGYCDHSSLRKCRDGSMVGDVDCDSTTDDTEAPECTPSTEVCDGQDNDCDGATDEGLSQSCGTDVGECQAGTQACQSGSWGPCQGEVGPATETCDGLDNDCDGTADENLIICSEDADCGPEAYVSDPYCENNDVMRTLLSPGCVNPGTCSASCTNSTQPMVLMACGESTCLDGSCTNQTGNMTG